MKIGLVIGKFMPVHEGHLALIRFAASQCDKLIVSMSYTKTDPIDHNLRFSWLREILKDDSKIDVNMVLDDFDDESLSLEARTKVWADFIRKTYGQVDVVFSSEEYGAFFSKHLHAQNIIFDQSRELVPISATRIRQHPFRYWQYIPEIVRPYFVKKVCMYGPESTGKSSMAEKLAGKFNTEFVPEVAREFISSNNFTVDDILRIARGQTQRLIDKSKTANKILFCDTDLITTQIYCRHYLGVIPDELTALEKQVQYDHYFLFDIDVPWVPDGLRDLGHRREEMYAIFKSELDRRNIEYTTVQGNWHEREEIISSLVQHWIE